MKKGSSVRIPSNMWMACLLLSFKSGAMQSQPTNLHDSVITSLDIDKIPVEINSELQNNTINNDELKQLYALELHSRVGDIILTKTGFRKSNAVTSTLIHWLTPLLITSVNEKEAVSKWKALSKEKNIEFPYAEMNKVLKLQDSEIGNLYRETQDFVQHAKPTIVKDLESRITGSYGHQWNDRYEEKQAPHPARCLEALQQKGLKIKFDSTKLDLLKKIATESTECSMSEKMKNERFLTINGFKNSKLALMVHDCFDHFWTFNLLEKNGTLKNYKTFLERIGNPQSTDIFCREGEMIASVAFDYRFAHLSPFKFNGYLKVQDFLNKLGNTENQMRAKHILESRKHDEDFNSKFSLVATGIFTELMEQRRKNGFIRDLGNNKEVMPTLDPEYLALITETYHSLDSNKDKAINVLLNLQLTMEDYLTKLATKKDTSSELTITLDTMETFDEKSCILNKEKVAWFKQNLGAVSTRSAVC